MAKKQTHGSFGFPTDSGKKGDSTPIVRRVHKGGGKANLDKRGHLQPGDSSGK